MGLLTSTLRCPATEDWPALSSFGEEKEKKWRWYKVALLICPANENLVKPLPPFALGRSGIKPANWPAPLFGRGNGEPSRGGDIAI